MFEGRRIKALGAMSGTSLDGVDAAMIETDGQQIFGFGPSDFRAYTAAEQATLRAHLGRWQNDDVSVAEKVVEAAHIEVLAGFRDVDLIGFHGQTLAHDPAARRTHQCGNGETLARALAKPVVWDFRSSDVAAGGQGAPLAPFFHHALAKWIGATSPLAFLNLGGVGNITFVDPTIDDPAAPGALFAFDTGPANAPMNDAMMARRGQPFDAGGTVAAQGKPDRLIVERFLSDPYFTKSPPKSLDRDAFVSLSGDVGGLSDADALATLAEAVAASVALGLDQCPQIPAQVLVTGGGRQNPTLMKRLSAALPCPVQPVEAVGLDGDMLEAQAFAYLAVRVARRLPLSAPGTTGVPAPQLGGRLAGKFNILP